MNRQELDIQEGRFLSRSNTYAAVQRSSSIGLCHSEMAMHAAKKMRHSRQKLKTGRAVCHHLRMMLTANEPVAAISSTLPDTLSRSGAYGPMNPFSRASRQQHETQFSLGL